MYIIYIKHLLEIVDTVCFSLQVNIFLPVFLLGAGTVLFVDGLLIYRYYQEQQNNGVGLLCSDIYQILGFTTVNANENDKYASIEFAGVLVSVLFYVRGCQFVCCAYMRCWSPTTCCHGYINCPTRLWSTLAPIGCSNQRHFVPYPVHTSICCLLSHYYYSSIDTIDMFHFQHTHTHTVDLPDDQFVLCLH